MVYRVPRYFFHVTGDLILHDMAGVVLPNDDSARTHAVRVWRQLGRISDGAAVTVVVVREGEAVPAFRIAGNDPAVS